MTHQITHSAVTGFKITVLLMGVGFALQRGQIGGQVKLTTSADGCAGPRRSCRLRVTGTIQAQLQ